MTVKELSSIISNLVSPFRPTTRNCSSGVMSSAIGCEPTRRVLSTFIPPGRLADVLATVVLVVVLTPKQQLLVCHHSERDDHHQSQAVRDTVASKDGGGSIVGPFAIAFGYQPRAVKGICQKLVLIIEAELELSLVHSAVLQQASSREHGASSTDAFLGEELLGR